MHERKSKDVGMKNTDLLRPIGHACVYGLYPQEEVFGVLVDDPGLSGVHFVVVYQDERPAGCGASKEIDASAFCLKQGCSEIPPYGAYMGCPSSLGFEKKR